MRLGWWWLLSFYVQQGWDGVGTGRIFGYTRLEETVDWNVEETVIMSIIVEERCWETKEDDDEEICIRNLEVAA